MKIWVVSLGCDKNRVDTEYMLGYLREGGHSFVSDAMDADVAIVNTCAFLESSRKEAIDEILQAAYLKKDKQDLKLIVTGCLPQKFIGELGALDEVDAFLGVNDYANICDIIDRLFGEGVTDRSFVGDMNAFCSYSSRVVTTGGSYAYLKISDGCNNFCSYCLIPKIRGRFRSVPILNLVREAKDLADDGVEELILVGQDTTKYGFDFDKKLHIAELIRELSKIDGIRRIRLLYCYPEYVTDELIAEMRDNSKVVKYIDIPFQHGDDGILKLMRRRETSKFNRELVDRLRREMPNIAIRSTFIVGFPTETEDAFLSLVDFVKNVRLDFAGFFSYSREPDTAAFSFEGQLPFREKRRRLAEISLVQAEIQHERLNGLIGSLLTVFVDGVDYVKQRFFGHSRGFCPDNDPKIFVVSDGDVIIESGKEYCAKVVRVYSNCDLLARIIGE